MNMVKAHYQGVMVPYEQHIGRRLDEVEEQIPLNQTENSRVEPVDNDTTIQFNSTYVEVLDKAYNWRGGVNFFAVGLIPLGVFIIGLCLWVMLTFDFSILNLVAGSGLTIGLCGLLFVLYKYLLKFDLFGYTYYPIRFNRKTRKVYVFKTKNDVREYAWDDLKIAVMKIHSGYKGDFDIRFNVVDEHGVIQDAFCLHSLISTRLEKSEVDGKYYFHNFDVEGVHLISNWEYIRHYMEEDISTSHKIVRGLIPLDKKRESVWQMMKASWFFSPKTYTYTEHGTAQGKSYKIDHKLTYRDNKFGDLVRGLGFFFILISFIGRLFVMNIAKRPIWPQWVNDACVVEANDPYNYERHPNNGHPKAIPTFAGYMMTALTVVLCYASVYIFLWVFDTVAHMKGSSMPRFSDYLAFWQWF